MGGNNLIQVLLASIKAKITPLVTKLKLLFSPNFIRARVITAFRKFLGELFNIKPRDKDDYYGVFGWLVSRRLAFAAVVVVGVLSLAFILSSGGFFHRSGTGVKSYSYRSVLLRFAKGTVQIRGKGGYLAYEGEVSKGSVTGRGTLYNRDGVVVYLGDFDKNKYEGNGTSYYNDGGMKYIGAFSQNLYEGKGKLYRANGSLEYDGEFSLGKKEGNGSLYDNGGNLIYTGAFAGDEILYSSMLGAEATDMAEAYKGKRTTYATDNSLVVVMDDIDAIYLGEGNEDALDDANTVKQVVVLRDDILTGNSLSHTIGQLRQYFGNEIYLGSSDITLPEAVAIRHLEAGGEETGLEADIDTEAQLDDYLTVNGWDESKEVYLHSFRRDGLIYSFVSKDSESPFLFYTIEQDGGAADE